MEIIDSLFACPVCGEHLSNEGRALMCLGCRKRYPIRAGVPSFTDRSVYWGEIGYEEMCRTNQVATEKGWKAALEEVVRLFVARRIAYVLGRR